VSAFDARDLNVASASDRVDDAETPGGGWGYPPGYAPYSRLDPVTGRDWP
jgi:hypothetical protein